MNRRRKARRLAIQQEKQQASTQPSSQNTKSREHKIKEKNPTEIESGDKEGDKKGLQRLAEMVQKIDEKIDHSENTIQTVVSSVKEWSLNNFNSVNSRIRQTQKNVSTLSQAINEELSLSRQNRSAQAAADAANSSRLISLGQDSSLRMLQYLTTSINSTTSDMHGKVGCMSDLILGMDPSDRKFVDRAQPILRQADHVLERLLNTTRGSPVAIIQSLRVSLKVLLVDDGFYELL
ncbi:predicted protein [Arabidopsis lyrata subsp. lyrata]|uniref:Predicted protein n=1 Tax=Arabidopsis lyrata subsp. lyrata TaxID=81972 RepID=D7LKR1_ARALL|nr:predicted protein [Arabidopsis lyrata subsp. lyrata]